MNRLFFTFLDLLIFLFGFIMFGMIIASLYFMILDASLFEGIGTSLSRFFTSAFLPSLLSSVFTVLAIYIWSLCSVKYGLAGEYLVEIYNNQTNVYDPFCRVIILTSVFQNRLKYRGYELKAKNKILVGEGTINNFRFMTGHYWKSKNTLESRFGSFLYEIDSSGKIFEGQFVYVDTSRKTINVDKARWVKK